MKPLFVGARLKVQRANHHIDDLKAKFAAFVDTRPYTLSIDENPDSGQAVLRIIFGKRHSSHWALIIGDAIHNLHSALDLMTYELVGRDGGKQDRYLKTPTGDSRTSFESSCNGIKTPSQSVKDMLKALEIFPGGKGNTLHALHNLDIADKHAILVPVVRAATVSEFSILNATGAVLSTWVNTKFIVGNDGTHINIASVPVGCRLELEDDAEITPEIVLDKIAGDIGYAPILPVLSYLSRETTKAIAWITEEAIKAGLHVKKV